MENVHIFDAASDCKGRLYAVSAERYRISEQHHTHDLVTKLQTTLSIEGILTILPSMQNSSSICLGCSFNQL